MDVPRQLGLGDIQPKVGTHIDQTPRGAVQDASGVAPGVRDARSARGWQAPLAPARDLAAARVVSGSVAAAARRDEAAGGCQAGGLVAATRVR